MFKGLKPLHLFLFGTAAMLLARTVKGDFVLEMGCLITALILYIFALIKYFKK